MDGHQKPDRYERQPGQLDCVRYLPMSGTPMRIAIVGTSEGKSAAGVAAARTIAKFESACSRAGTLSTARRNRAEEIAKEMRSPLPFSGHFLISRSGRAMTIAR